MLVRVNILTFLVFFFLINMYDEILNFECIMSVGLQGHTDVDKKDKYVLELREGNHVDHGLCSFCTVSKKHQVTC